MGLITALLLGTLAAAGTVAGSVVSSNAQKKTNEQNLDLQEKTWEREDNAVQRRVSDLEAAGLSKTLAAGSAASSSSPIQLKSADIGSGISGASSALAGTILQAVQLKNELATSAMERVRLAAEANKANAEADFTRMSRTDYTRAQTDLLVLEKYKEEAIRAKDYPQLRQIEEAISKTKKEIEVMDIGLDKSKVELSNLKYDSYYHKSMGYSSKGATSQVGKTAGDVGGFVRYSIDSLAGYGKQAYNALRGIF